MIICVLYFYHANLKWSLQFRSDVTIWKLFITCSFSTNTNFWFVVHNFANYNLKKLFLLIFGSIIKFYIIYKSPLHFFSTYFIVRKEIGCCFIYDYLIFFNDAFLQQQRLDHDGDDDYYLLWQLQEVLLLQLLLL